MKRVALVVGAAGGVGLEVARQLLAAGFEVIGTVLDKTEAARLAAIGPLKDVIELDLGDAGQVAAALAPRLDRLDAVVHCAAISPYGPLEIASLAQLRRTLEINTVSAVAVYQACIPLLRARRGRLALVGSFAGKVGVPFVGHYVASKFALEGLADVMRREARPWGVKVVLFEPGSIKTPMLTGQIATIGRDRAALTAEQAERYGGLYEVFAGHLNNGMASGLDPAFVAANVVAALQEDDPQPRYRLGDDAAFLCQAAATQSDRELDDIMAGMMNYS